MSGLTSVTSAFGTYYKMQLKETFQLKLALKIDSFSQLNALLEPFTTSQEGAPPGCKTLM
jgi:hypothetical protein